MESSKVGGGQLRFGIILNIPQFARWEANCVSLLLRSGMCRFQVLIIAHRRSEHLLMRLLRAVRYPLWTVYTASSAYPQTSRLLKNNPFSEPEVIHCSEQEISTLKDETLQSIRDQRLDFLLNFGPSRVDKRLLAIPRYGIWRFTCGEEYSDNTERAAFLPVLMGYPVILLSLMQFSSNHQSPAKILRSGYFAVERCSNAKTLDRARLACADFPVLACNDLLNGRQGRTPTKSYTEQRPQGTIPGNLIMLRLILGLIRSKLLRVMSRSFTRRVWNSGFIGTADFDPANNQSATNVRWLPKCRDSIADPFIIQHENRSILLTEHINRTDNRGFIEAWRIQNGVALSLGRVIEGPVHLSYPYIVRWQGNIYCIPEQAQAHAIFLYRAIQFPVHWERVGQILSEVDAIDPTVFRYGSYWWLAYTDAAIDRYGRLMLWYSNELLGPWSPHPLNPVKIDPRSARGAGPPFSHGDDLVRPAQDCCGEYGARIVFNRIAKLTAEEFDEDVIGELKPDPRGPYPAGLHTICRDGDIAAVDGKAYVIDPTVWLRKYIGRLHNMGGEKALKD